MVKEMKIVHGFEFEFDNLEFSFEKNIRVKYTICYLPEMNGIAKNTKSLIAIKSCILLLDSNLDISEIFLAESFNNFFYFLRCTLFHHLNLTHYYKYDCKLSKVVKMNTIWIQATQKYLTLK